MFLRRRGGSWQGRCSSPDRAADGGHAARELLVEVREHGDALKLVDRESEAAEDRDQQACEPELQPPSKRPRQHGARWASIEYPCPRRVLISSRPSFFRMP